MEDATNIISKMTSQHRVLQKHLSDAMSLSSSIEPDCPEIDRILKQFNKDLSGHLELENNVFYVELIEKMRKKNWDTAKTEQFINAMKDIGKIVISFLERYKDDKIIKSEMAEFRPELKSIIDMLNLRVESEEAGVYTYWGMF